VTNTSFKTGSTDHNGGHTPGTTRVAGGTGCGNLSTRAAKKEKKKRRGLVSGKFNQFISKSTNLHAQVQLFSGSSRSAQNSGKILANRQG
jgi:hypothetical protein